MHAIHRILAAVKDTRAKTQPGIDKAAVLARALDAQLCLFHGINDPICPDLGTVAGLKPAQVEAYGCEQHRQRLEGLARPLRRHGITVTTAVQWDYPLHEAIIRAAEAFEADLVVATAHPGRHHLPWLLHYTDWELLRTATMPVLLVKDAKPWHRPPVLAAVDPEHAFDKPAALDGEILRFSATLAEALGGKVHAVHAYLPLPPFPDLSGPLVIEAELAAAQDHAQAVLERVAGPLGIPRRRRHAVARHPIDAIADVAREIGSGIVALGSVSRSGVDRVFIGNTAEALIDSLKCDVLVVKPPGFRNKVMRTPRGARLVPLPLAPAGV
ncbi:MAG TPA: universal stress protein [Steroidobacteraceae bacterium]|nr:universal stress protein [Steroidobacteraceae bacterium]